MAYSLEEVRKLLQTPKNQHEIQRAVEKKLRQNVHAETITSDKEYNRGHNEILQWIKKDVLGNEESFKNLNGLIRPPFPTNELSETIFQDVARIFNGQNFYQKIEWSGTNKEKEAKEFLDSVGDAGFWESQALEAYQSDIDSYVVCDWPVADPEQPDKNLDPFYYILPIEKVYSVSLEKKGQGNRRTISVEFIAFWCGHEEKKHMAYFDRDQIIVFADDMTTVKVGPIFHKIGWTPVHPFWQTTLNSRTMIQKRNRATKSISDMDWLFFYEYAKRWQDLNNPFPVWAMYDSNCQYKDSDGNECVRGYVNYLFDGKPEQKLCPDCATKFRRGPDRTVKVPAPQNREDPDLMSHPPVQIISPAVESQQFVREEVERLNNKILKNCAGISTDAIKKQAVNEDQVQTSLDSQKSILVWEKRNFDEIRNWVTKTILKMKFGEALKAVHTDHGEEFFLESQLEQVQEYKAAKDSNLPSYDLKTRREALLQSKFRNNPDALDRAKLMSALEPFPDYTLTEMIALRTAAPEAVSLEDLVIKKNFSNFIDQFEAENGSLAMFGSDIVKKGKVTDKGENTAKIRLELIKKQLEEYAREKINAGRNSFSTSIQAEREKRESEQKQPAGGNGKK